MAFYVTETDGLLLNCGVCFRLSYRITFRHVIIQVAGGEGNTKKHELPFYRYNDSSTAGCPTEIISYVTVQPGSIPPGSGMILMYRIVRHEIVIPTRNQTAWGSGKKRQQTILSQVTAQQQGSYPTQKSWATSNGSASEYPTRKWHQVIVSCYTSEYHSPRQDGINTHNISEHPIRNWHQVIVSKYSQDNQPVSKKRRNQQAQPIL